MVEFKAKPLRVQVLSYDRLPRALQLLRLGRHELSRRPGIRARLFAMNKHEVLPQLATNDLEKALLKRVFNAVELTSPNENSNFNMRFEVSPNNVLWADTRKADGPSPKDELIRMGFESLQMRIAGLGIKNYPTALDCSVAIGRPENGDYYQSALEWVVESLEDANLEPGCIGVADLLHGLTGETWSSLANSLDVPPGSDQNQGKFDRLHDIMICWPPVAEQLAKRLNGAVHTVTIRGSNSLAVVAVPPDQGLRRDAVERVRDWLVAPTGGRREDSFIPGPSNYPIHSKREYLDLDARGLVPRLNWDWILQPIIGEETAIVLGIEADEMVVLPMERMLATRIEKEAREAIKKEGIIAENIFKCHEQVYSRYFNPEYMHRVFERLRNLKL